MKFNNIFIEKNINLYYYMNITEYNHIGGDKLDLIEIFKALGDENRIRILNLLIRQVYNSNKLHSMIIKLTL
ncbi:hypothetical protein JCM39194_19060 [Desulfotomaculum varum]